MNNKLISSLVFMMSLCVSANLIISNSIAEEQAPSSCYKHFSEWDEAVRLKELVKNSHSLSEKVKSRLINQFSELQQRHDSFYYGRAPICRENEDIISQNKSLNSEIDQYNSKVEEHKNEISRFKAQCSAPETEEKQSSCETWATQIDSRLPGLQEWLDSLNKKKENLIKLADEKNSRGDALNREWVDLLNSFNTSAKNELEKGVPDIPVIPVANWSGRWEKYEEQLVNDRFGGLKDTSLRNWIAANAEVNRFKRDNFSPLTAYEHTLRFKDDFFSRDITDAKREDLLAFEGGKVFWNVMKNKPVEGGTLQSWFLGCAKSHDTAIANMKKAEHKNDSGFSEITDYDTPSQFAYIFRAQALQLNKPREPKAQQEWDNVIGEFQRRVDQLLQGGQ